MSNLRIVCMDNILEIGKSVDKFLMIKNKVKSSYLMNVKRDRFNNGEGKFTILESIRDKDVFILSDVGNYGVTYNMHGIDVPMGPDEHFQDIKRCISAMSGYAKRIVLVMPLLYQSRQHRSKGRESLDCAIALQELIKMNVDCIMTIDCHDPNVQNAIPFTPFENLYPSHYILEEFLKNEDIDYRKVMAISPDYGAISRTTYYANILGCPMGTFNKRRDYSKVQNGTNAIVSHEYNGGSVKGKNMFIVDDMIASGSSILDTARRLKAKGATNIYFVASFCLFTNGIEMFDKAYEENLFKAIYTTNATYIPEEYKKRPYLKVVDISPYIAEVIEAMNRGESISDLLDGRDKKLVLVHEVNQRKGKRTNK